MCESHGYNFVQFLTTIRVRSHFVPFLRVQGSVSQKEKGRESKSHLLKSLGTSRDVNPEKNQKVVGLDWVILKIVM